MAQANDALGHIDAVVLEPAGPAEFRRGTRQTVLRRPSSSSSIRTANYNADNIDQTLENVR
jgi:hypothetical protein